ncbi:MAG: glycosyltransferase [Chitinivibrionales bacterium]|nr:glycosyltransferase [Chitinivibrionales bacterium]MBD3355756.1 glycosyltransferase [Chitinivibrionales bacterium]
MRILFLTYQGHVEGSTNSIAFLADGLARRGHDIFVGCPKGRHLWRILERSHVKRLPMVFPRKGSMTTMRLIRDAVRAYGIQIINAQASHDRYASILARRLYRLRCKVVHTRRQFPRSIGGPLQNWFYVHGTDRIVVISHSLKRIFVERGIPSKHMTVIHNGTPRDRYKPPDPEVVTSLRARFGFSPEDRVVGCVSRLKNQDQLVRAMPLLEDLRVKLLFVGIEPGTFGELARELGVEDRVYYAGLVGNREALDYYGLFSASVLASTMEGFGLVLVEAMAYDVPVVATKAQGIVDVVRDGENGLLFEDGDVGGLARGLRRILTDTDLRRHLCLNGRTSAFEEFTLEKTLDNYESFFKELTRE